MTLIHITRKLINPAMETKEEFGRKIADLRAAKDMTQQELADAAGVSREHISEVERSVTSPSIFQALKIVRGLGLTPAQFFGSTFQIEASDGEPDVHVVRGYEYCYRLLTGIIENGERLWINSIVGNLYGMYKANGKPLPPGVPEPDLEGTFRPVRKEPVPGRQRKVGGRG